MDDDHLSCFWWMLFVCSHSHLRGVLADKQERMGIRSCTQGFPQCRLARRLASDIGRWLNRIGTFLTFAQFLYVTLQTASSQLYFPRDKGKSSWTPRIRKREVPMSRWLVQVILFLAISLSEYPEGPETSAESSEQLCFWS